MFQPRRGALKGVVLSLDSADPALLAGTLDFSRDVLARRTVKDSDAGRQQFTAAVEIELAGGVSVTLDKLVIRVIDDQAQAERGCGDTVAPADLDTVLLPTTRQTTSFRCSGTSRRSRKRSVETVRCVLNAHRDLCEDVLSVETVRRTGSAICADIEVAPDGRPRGVAGARLPRDRDSI